MKSDALSPMVHLPQVNPLRYFPCSNCGERFMFKRGYAVPAFWEDCQGKKTHGVLAFCSLACYTLIYTGGNC